MKKTLLIAIAFISPFFSVGQIVLDQTDLPNIGDIQIMIGVDSAQGAGLSPGASGADAAPTAPAGRGARRDSRSCSLG